MSRYSESRECINWNADNYVQVLKMLSWVIKEREGLGQEALWERCKVLVPIIFQTMFPGAGTVTLQRIVNHVMRAQRKEITPEKLYQRADKTGRYQEFNETVSEVVRIYEETMEKPTEEIIKDEGTIIEWNNELITNAKKRHILLPGQMWQRSLADLEYFPVAQKFFSPQTKVQFKKLRNSCRNFIGDLCARPDKISRQIISVLPTEPKSRKGTIVLSAGVIWVKDALSKTSGRSFSRLEDMNDFVREYVKDLKAKPMPTIVPNINVSSQQQMAILTELVKKQSKELSELKEMVNQLIVKRWREDHGIQ
jgi:hypothetical protein